MEQAIHLDIAPIHLVEEEEAEVVQVSPLFIMEAEVVQVSPLVIMEALVVSPKFIILNQPLIPISGILFRPANLWELN